MVRQHTPALGPSRGDRARNEATHPESCTCFAACFSARYALDNLNKEYNALNKAVAKLKIVRLRSKRLKTTSTAGTDAACLCTAYLSPPRRVRTRLSRSSSVPIWTSSA